MVTTNINKRNGASDGHKRKNYMYVVVWNYLQLLVKALACQGIAVFVKIDVFRLLL